MDMYKIEVPDDLDQIIDTLGKSANICLDFGLIGLAIEEKLSSLLERILSFYKREAMADVLFSCLTEVITNAFKANSKEIIADNENLDLSDEYDHSKVTNIMRKNMSKDWISGIISQCEAVGRFVRLYISYDPDGIIFIVKNRAKLRPFDEARIRDKFSKGMLLDDIITFYLQYGDNTEGAGLGFIFNLLLLKAEGIDPSLFRVGSDGDSTFARIEIPITEDFKSYRSRRSDAKMVTS